MIANDMKRIAIVAILSVTLFACNAPSTLQKDSAKIEQKMAWLDKADPVQMAAQDIAKMHYRFFSVCGYSCSTVGVGTLTKERCFASVPVEIIEGTSDAVLSIEHKRLINRAY